MPKLAGRLLLVWAAAANAIPLQTTTTVNISDAWLLTDSESPVFYRHFRDKVTWAEAESVCQFHHSVLATVRNTAEFDRTRALLRQLEWSTPVWVGLRRFDGQPMFKWSTPAGATLEASEGYWHEPPNSATSTPQCVTIDPAADFRWKAVDCTSPIEIHSFLCQIPVPVWVRAEQGGCLSPKWPNKEVTVQYIPQTRALEMTADCGLRGTRRIACKHNSEKDLRKMEQKLQCAGVVDEVHRDVAPSRPVTRHRRDVDVSDAPPAASPTTSPPLETSPSTEDQVKTKSSSEKSAPPTEAVTENAKSTEADKAATTEESSPAKVTTEPSAKLQQQTTEQEKKLEITSSSSAAPEISTAASTQLVKVEAKPEAETSPSTPKEETTPAPTAAPTEEPTQSPKMNVEIIAHIYDTSTDGTAINRVFTIEEIPTEQQEQATKTSGQQEEAEEQMQNTQPLVVAKHHEHVVVPGVPRNVPSTVTQHDPPHHPPMVLLASHHNITPGVPRIVAVPPPQPPHGQPPFLYHPMAHHDGHPRLEETRSAEDHVALRRKQFLPTPLQGPAVEAHHHAPLMYHQLPLEATTLIPTSAPELQTESDKTEEEDIEFQDEEPEALQAAKMATKMDTDEQSTEDTLNAQTDEEIFEAENRLKGRRGEEKTRERHIARSLYPFILNRLLG